MASILLIEDDSNFREVLKEMLTTASHTVREASNGEEGYQAFAQEPADLVITDLMMPKKDGIILIQELMSRFPRARIIAMSGAATGNPAWLPIAKSAGAIKVIKKPFSREALLEAVNEGLSNPWR